MVIKNDQVFNLMNTNGRRKDVINAYNIYLEVLRELNSSHPSDKWEVYPKSVKQVLFYENALEKSKDVFKDHKKYEEFKKNVNTDYNKFISKNKGWIQKSFKTYKDTIDKDIESRARHYTSNLVTLGLTLENRDITAVGETFLEGKVSRDLLEQILPIDDINILLIRQLAKLKIFTDSTDVRRFYSPFFMALNLLLSDGNIDREKFKFIVQGITPYFDDKNKDDVISNKKTIDEKYKIVDNSIVIKQYLKLATSDTINENDFNGIFLNRKSSKLVGEYYEFYTALKVFVDKNDEKNYNKLIEQIDKNYKSINKAFGYGGCVFKIGNRGNRPNLSDFVKLNKDHTLLKAKDFNKNFYATFVKSKKFDTVREYSDTTMRLFEASGIIKFKNLPELAYEDIFNIIFTDNVLANRIFGEMTEGGYKYYEQNIMGDNLSLVEILGFTDQEIKDIISSILVKFEVSSIENATEKIVSKKNDEFIKHIQSKYTKEKIIELLSLFSDRNNDKHIQVAVNPSALVPTIYEYIVGIAWYYISEADYELYESMNLTLNADFEPVFHAGGGTGDIVINYSDRLVMLEVTLMNKQAQKRGEWEPVLRHSLNLKADNPDKETITFFVADELDVNTINIWRAVSAVPLESTTNHKKVDNVIIMPLKNSDVIDFLNKGICKEKIISETIKSFSSVAKITETEWHKEVIDKMYD